MNKHQTEISSQEAAGSHAVLILDGAGWRKLTAPGNISLLPLRPTALN